MYFQNKQVIPGVCTPRMGWGAPLQWGSSFGVGAGFVIKSHHKNNKTQYRFTQQKRITITSLIVRSPSIFNALRGPAFPQQQTDSRRKDYLEGNRLRGCKVGFDFD